MFPFFRNIVVNKLDYSVLLKCRSLISKLRSFWLRPQFSKMGNHTIFEKTGYLKGLKYISIGDNVHFDSMIFLTAWDRFAGETFSPRISIGDNCSFGAFNHITSINRIIIGDGCLVGKFVTISDNNHGNTEFSSLMISPMKRKLVSNGGIIIGKNVWIGDKATILGDVEIGEGAVIAANAVVTSNVDSYSVVAGCPAKVIKYNHKG